jgi:hypothetical protein
MVQNPFENITLPTILADYDLLQNKDISFHFFDAYEFLKQQNLTTTKTKRREGACLKQVINE